MKRNEWWYWWQNEADSWGPVKCVPIRKKAKKKKHQKRLVFIFCLVLAEHLRCFVVAFFLLPACFSETKDWRCWLQSDWRRYALRLHCSKNQEERRSKGVRKKRSVRTKFRNHCDSNLFYMRKKKQFHACWLPGWAVTKFVPTMGQIPQTSISMWSRHLLWRFVPFASISFLKNVDAAKGTNEHHEIRSLLQVDVTNSSCVCYPCL